VEAWGGGRVREPGLGWRGVPGGFPVASATHPLLAQRPAGQFPGISGEGVIEADLPRVKVIQVEDQLAPANMEEACCPGLMSGWMYLPVLVACMHVWWCRRDARFETGRQSKAEITHLK